MRIDRRSGTDLRRILTAMIVDPLLLGRVSSVWSSEAKGLFKSRWENLIGWWCVKYHRKYGKAPGKAIESIFESWSDGKDQETVNAIDKFLSGLSSEYERSSEDFHTEHLIDLAGRYFNRVKIQTLVDNLQSDLDGNNIEKAQEHITKHSNLEMGSESWIDVIHDKAAIVDAYSERAETLIHYPGALGQFFGDELQRDAFVAIQAGEKRGKSMMLADIAWRAMLERRRVAFFEVGDMSQRQILKRLYIRAARRPKYSKTVTIPTKIRRTELGGWSVLSREKYFKTGIGPSHVSKALDEITETKVRTKKSLFRLSCHPNNTMNVEGIKSILEQWSRGGWIADCVIIDYADILASPVGVTDPRERINITWQNMRQLSQMMHCLVVTATQAKASSYAAHTMTRLHFADDKRKLAHVTAMLAMNQTTAEKEQGILRLNWIGSRDSDYNEGRCVVVASCLDLGNPTVISRFPRDEKKEIQSHEKETEEPAGKTSGRQHKRKRTRVDKRA